jgi:hypothetical protein
LKTPPIDKLPNLIERLGKAETARIRYAQKGTGRRQPGAQNIINTIRAELCEGDNYRIPPEVDDILTAAVQQERHTTKPLSIRVLYVILQCVPIINSREIQLMLNVTPRQAQRYVKALRFALPFLVRAVRITLEKRRLAAEEKPKVVTNKPEKEDNDEQK